MKPIIRLWDIANKQMIYPDEVAKQGFVIAANGTGVRRRKHDGPYALTLVPLIYIGRKDCNYRMIYEADYVAVTAQSSPKLIARGVVVYYQMGCSWVINTGIITLSFSDIHQSRMAVVGNRYEHPDMKYEVFYNAS